MTTALAPRTTFREVDRPFTWVSPLREATGGAQLDDEKRRARVVIITEGLGNARDRNYYLPSAIQSCVAVFESAQFFVDHPSTIDDETRPERSMENLAGYFSEVSVGTVRDTETQEDLAACFATVNCSAAAPGILAYEQIKTAIEQQRKYPGTKNVYCGISINGNGSSHPGTIRGMAVNMVTAIREAFSADIVTKPARGGRFLTLVQESQRMVTRLGGRTAHGAQKGGAHKESAMKLAQRGRVITREAEAEVEARKAHLMTDEGMKAFAGKMGRLAEMRAAGAEAADSPDAQELLKDIDMDLAALKSLKDGADDGGGDGGGDGTGQDEEEARRRAAEDEARRRAGEGEGRRRAGESEEEAETRRRAAEDVEARRRTGEGEAARRTGESEEEAEARRKAAEDEEEAEARRRAAEDEDMGMTGEGEEEAGPKMAYTCEGCGAETEVMPPKGFRLVATESWKRAAESLRAARQREAALTGRLTGKEARFVRTNESHVQDTKLVLRENADLRRRNERLEAVLEAQKVLRENQIPRDILKWESLVTYPRVQWRDRIDQALRTKALEAKLIAGGNRERGAGGITRETQTGTFDVAASFDKHVKAQG